MNLNCFKISTDLKSDLFKNNAKCSQFTSQTLNMEGVPCDKGKTQ